MEIIFYLIILTVSFYILIVSSGVLVSSLVFISRFLQISEYAVSFVLMALATSLPEFFVGISSALSDKPQISFGNIVGANIINVTLAIGLVAIFAGIIKTSFDDVKNDSFIAIAVALSPIIFIWDGVLSRSDGAILIVLFFGHIVYLIKSERHADKIYDSMEHTLASFKDFAKNLFKFIFGCVILLVSSATIVWSVSHIAGALDISLFFAGLILVALGTTLPELIFGIRSARLGRASMAFGNVFGSVAVNSALILGTVALISPIYIVDFKPVFFGFLMMAISLIVFGAIVKYKNKINREVGIALILFYIVFLSLEFLMK